MSLSHYPFNPERQLGNHTVVWIGTAANRLYLNDIAPALSALARQIPGVCLKIISDGLEGLAVELFDPCRIELVEWSSDSEVEFLQTATVGIMPLPEDSWASRKCGYKLLQYMASGLPVVASPVGVNTRLVNEGENGWLAADLDQWQQTLAQILTNPQQALTMGNKGRALVEQEFSTEKWTSQLAQWFRDAVAGYNKKGREGE